MPLPASLSAQALAGRLRLDGTLAVDPALGTRLTGFQALARELVFANAPRAPEAVSEQAVIAMVAFLQDRPTAAEGFGFASPFVQSGARSMLRRWLTRRAVRIAGGSAATATAADDEDESEPEVPLEPPVNPPAAAPRFAIGFNPLDDQAGPRMVLNADDPFSAAHFGALAATGGAPGVDTVATDERLYMAIWLEGGDAGPPAAVENRPPGWMDGEAFPNWAINLGGPPRTRAGPFALALHGIDGRYWRSRANSLRRWEGGNVRVILP